MTVNPWISAHSSLLRAAAGEYVRDYAHYFAGAMVYYALLSLVPLLVLLMAALGWLLRLSPLAVDLEQQLLQHGRSHVRRRLARRRRTSVSLYLQRGSTIATLIGIVGLLMTSSALFAHLRMTFRALWKQAPPLASGSILSAAADETHRACHRLRHHVRRWRSVAGAARDHRRVAMACSAAR